MESDQPLDESETALSFGPHFGQEAADEFVRRLEGEGLIYFDDLFVMSDFPEWCEIRAAAPTGEEAER